MVKLSMYAVELAVCVEDLNRPHDVDVPKLPCETFVLSHRLIP